MAILPKSIDFAAMRRLGPSASRPPPGISPDKCDATLETVKMMIKLVAISKLM